jgi:hypothetical protein
MREFIYRIWDKEAKKYVMIGSLYGCEGTAGLSCYFNRNTHVVEEYTGLHDSKGNKIFEGDILYFVARYIYTEPAEVIYYGSSYGCITHDERGVLKEYTDLRHIVEQYHPEVIGNRHQLPCKPDHNGECIHCDCWLTDCPLLKNENNGEV